MPEVSLPTEEFRARGRNQLNGKARKERLGSEWRTRSLIQPAPIFRDVPQCLSPKVDHSSASVARSVRRILVSSTRKPISYINLAKRFLQEHGEVQLSALGIAVAPMVTVAEILKNRGLAVEKKLCTSLESLSDDYRTRQKPKMDIVLTKSPDFDDIIAQESQATGPSAGDDMATQLEGALTVEEDMDEEGCTGKEVDEVDL